MHTFTYDDDGEITIHHNGDFSGYVLINVPKENISSVPMADDKVEVRLPFGLLEELVMRKIRDEMIEKLEQMTGHQLSELLSSL